VSSLNYTETRENGQVIYQPPPEVENKPEVINKPEVSKITPFCVRNDFHVRYDPGEDRTSSRHLRYKPDVTQREHRDEAIVTQRATSKNEIPEIRVTDTGVCPIRNVYTDNPISSNLTNSNNNIRTSCEKSHENFTSTSSSHNLPQEAHLHKEAYSDCPSVVNDSNCTRSHIDEYGVRNSDV